MYANYRTIHGIVTSRSVAQGPVENITYSVRANDGDLLVTLNGITPLRWYPPGTIVFAANVGDPCRITWTPGTEPIVEVVEPFDPANCGQVPT